LGTPQEDHGLERRGEDEKKKCRGLGRGGKLESGRTSNICKENRQMKLGGASGKG